MRKIFLIFLLILFFVFINGFFIDENLDKALENNNSVNVIVTFKDKSQFLKNSFNANSIISNLNDNEFEGSYYSSSKIAIGIMTKEGLEKLKINNNIDKILLDYPIKATLNDSLKIVNSSLVNNLRIRGTTNVTGRNISVCVLDTGVNYNLTNLGGSLGKKVLGGYNFVGENNDSMDDNGHGTHVAAIIAANGSIKGVAPDANIVSIKVLNANGGGSTSNLIRGIQWCVDNSTLYNIKVITMSLACNFELFNKTCDGETICDASELKSVVNSAIAKNISVIAATGNDFNNAKIATPACLSNVTSVSSINKDYTLANYGNRNNLTLLVAPGTSIVSLNRSGEILSLSGTSMAAPHVAGIYALLIQYLKDEKNIEKTNQQIKEVLNSTGKIVLDSATGYSYSIVDAYKALLKLDDVAPELKLDSPQNQTYIVGNVSLNFTSVDTNLNSTWYSLDSGINTTLNGNVSIKLTNGNHVFYLYSNDSSGNLNTTSVSFSVNTTIITLNQPDNNLTDYDGNITFNCSAISNFELKNISLWHNLSGNFKLNQTNVLSGFSNYSLFNLSTNKNLTFIWSCLVYNINETYSFGENRTLKIKINNKPNITTYLPSNLSAIINEGSNLSFNHSSIDNDNDSLTYYWLLNNNFKSNLQNYTFSPNYTDSGNYNLSLIVSDIAVNTSINWSVTVNNLILCGNNIKESGESCDGTDLSGNSCTSLGYTGGSLSCSNSCTFVTSSCTNTTSGGSSGGNSNDGGSGSGGGGTKTGDEFNEVLKPTQSAENKITENKNIDNTPKKIIIKDLVVEETERPLKIIKGETLNFIYDNNTHSLTLDNIQTESIDITISSDPIKITLKLNEEKIVIIGEGKELKIKLESILDDEVTLKLTKIKSLNNSPKGITGFSIYNEKLKDYGFGALGLLLVIFFIFWFFKTRTRKN